MRLRKEKGDRIKGALQATRDPNVPNNNAGYRYYTKYNTGTHISYNIL